MTTLAPIALPAQTADRRRRIVLLLDDVDARAAATALASVATTARLPPHASSVWRAAYRRAALAVVPATHARAAVLMQRFCRVPFAVIDGHDAAAPPRRAGRYAVGQAAFVLTTDGDDSPLSRLAPHARTVRLDDHELLRAVVRDTALAPAARDPERLGWRSLLADGWTFANARATRIAMRLMRATGRTAAPTHPHHLVPAPWHRWYLQHLGPDDSVLDVGCSDGGHTLVAARRARTVVGIDVDAAALARARTRAREGGLTNVRFDRADLADPRALESLGRFDVVLALDVLEHLADRRTVLRALRAALRPGGRLVISVPNATTPYRRWLRRQGAFAYMDPDHKLEYTREILIAELESAGLRAEVVARGGYDSPFAGLNALVAVVSLRLYAALAARRAKRAAAQPAHAAAWRVVAR